MSSYAPLTEVQANAVYDILLEHAEEVEEYHSREQFIYAQTEAWQPEYRFMGGLGFGGKFRRRGDDSWAVDCYSEDMNPHRRQLIDATNKALAELQATFA